MLLKNFGMYFQGLREGNKILNIKLIVNFNFWYLLQRKYYLYIL